MQHDRCRLDEQLVFIVDDTLFPSTTPCAAGAALIS